MTDAFPVLYILMRQDLASMNSGKAIAQGSHCSNAFVFAQLKEMLKSPWKTVKDFYKVFIKGEFNEDANGFLRWVHSTKQGFGTVLTLAVNERQMRTAVQFANLMGFASEVIHDPTYPLVDGETVHYIPLDTCAYVFGSKNDPNLEAVVGHFPLHP